MWCVCGYVVCLCVKSVVKGPLCGSVNYAVDHVICMKADLIAYILVCRNDTLSVSELTAKLEPAFLSGLRSTPVNVHAKYVEVSEVIICSILRLLSSITEAVSICSIIEAVSICSTIEAVSICS